MTLPLNDAAVFPRASRAVTSSFGVIAVATVVVEGCSVKASCAAVAGLIVKNALVAAVSPAAVAVSL